MGSTYVIHVCVYPCMCASSQIAGLRQDLEESGTVWAARVEGLKSTIQATSQHARAVEEQLAMRPTNQQVCCVLFFVCFCVCLCAVLCVCLHF